MIFFSLPLFTEKCNRQTLEDVTTTAIKAVIFLLFSFHTRKK
jgi:hypothetical protein